MQEVISQLEAYKKLGTPEEIQKQKEELEDYQKLGAPEEIEELKERRAKNDELVKLLATH